MGSSRSKICKSADAYQTTDHGREWEQASSAVRRHELGAEINDRCK